MPTLEQAAGSPGAGMGASLQAGIVQLSGGQLFTFTLYARMILPADGFVFYVLASAANPPPADPTPADLAAYSFIEQGSLHVAQRINQVEDNTTSFQDVTFTTKREIREFVDVAAGALWIMTLPNGTQVAFSAQRGRYDQAGIWHYYGRALYPYEATQIIASPDDIPADNVVSNSLPFWLSMSTQDLPVYPSFLVPQNAVPPYVAADVGTTDGIGASPLYGPNYSQSQLVTETVQFVFYGVRGNGVLDFQRALLQNSGDASEGKSYAVMNIPVPTDGKKPQSEFGIIAQQKTMALQVNYYQARARTEARKLILSAFINITTE